MGGDKKLFTPGPLNTSMAVKEAMLKDFGSRDEQFLQAIRDVRSSILDVADVSSDVWTTVILQGSGTYAVEAVLQTSTPRNGGRVLILANGAYGKRMETMCKVTGIDYDIIKSSEILPMDLTQIEEQLKSGTKYTTVSIVHCETSSGVLNHVEKVADLVRQYQPGASMFVDGMSSFGAIPLDLENIDFVVSSANKCLQGVPGFAYALCRKSSLEKCYGNSRSLSLDLADQEKNMVATGQFRFTPPIHTMLAFLQAMQEFKEEGGLPGRAKRYSENCEALKAGMAELGFKALVDEEHASYIITCFLFPNHPNFNFKTFYSNLSAKDQIIYPGKVTDADCFRMGNIGHIHIEDIAKLLETVKEVLGEMEIPVPVTY